MQPQLHRRNGKHPEGKATKAIEPTTTAIPSVVFLGIAGGALAGAAALHLAGKRHAALFVGQWVPTVLLLGIYNKIVKISGSDNTPRGLRVNAH